MSLNITNFHTYPLKKELLGSIIPEILQAVREQQKSDDKDNVESAFEMKQSTMPDVVSTDENLFSDVRPSLVVGEGDTQGALPNDQVAEYALGAVAQMNLKLSNKFEDQFVSKYLPRIFAWSLKYDCGGPEYPDLFGDWTALEQGSVDTIGLGIRERWRRIAGEAVVTPCLYAQMLATRPETQVSGDWMLVPTARNLHWRHCVLHSAFKLCKQKVAPGESLNQNLIQLIEAARHIWERMLKNSVTIKGLEGYHLIGNHVPKKYKEQSEYAQYISSYFSICGLGPILHTHIFTHNIS